MGRKGLSTQKTSKMEEQNSQQGRFTFVSTLFTQVIQITKNNPNNKR